MPVSESESWTVLGGDGSPIESADSFLTYLAALERSPNTQRAYATSLKLWFEFLETVGVDWAEVRVDEVARFVSWLRAPAPDVVVLDGGTARRSPATVNRHLAAIEAFLTLPRRPGW
jgi:site-specific recombinase XerD